MLAAISYDPIVKIDLGPLSVSPHGIGIALGFIAGAAIFLPVTRRKGWSDDDIYSLLTRAAIGAVIGARVAYVMNHFSEYDSPLEVLQVWKGGISLLGGFFGAILLALPRIKKLGLSFWKVMDTAAPGMALGVIVGRIGDLIVADHLGKTTNFFLGYKCPPLNVDTASPCAPTDLVERTPGAIVHQTALYDFLIAIALFGLLLLLRKRVRFDGFLLVVFGACYASARIVEDFLREDLRRFGLTGSQWAAIATLSACLYVLVVTRRTPKWGRWDEPDDGHPADGAETADTADTTDATGRDTAAPAPTLTEDAGAGDEAGPSAR